MNKNIYMLVMLIFCISCGMSDQQKNQMNVILADYKQLQIKYDKMKQRYDSLSLTCDSLYNQHQSTAGLQPAKPLQIIPDPNAVEVGQELLNHMRKTLNDAHSQANAAYAPSIFAANPQYNVTDGSQIDTNFKKSSGQR